MKRRISTLLNHLLAVLLQRNKKRVKIMLMKNLAALLRKKMSRIIIKNLAVHNPNIQKMKFLQYTAK